MKKSLIALAVMASGAGIASPGAELRTDIKKTIDAKLGLAIHDGTDTSVAGGGMTGDPPAATDATLNYIGNHGGADGITKMGGAGERTSVVIEDGFNTSGIGAWPGERGAVSDGFGA